MFIISLFGGLVSQIRAFYLGYKLAKKFEVDLVLDLSNYYNGYYRPYILDLLNVPDCLRIAIRGNLTERLKKMTQIFHHQPIVVDDGRSLEIIYTHFDSSSIYYLVNDCCYYDDFCRKNPEFFFRYLGNDYLTAEIMSMMQMASSSRYIEKFDSQIEDCECVGVHIRLKDFVKIGWMVDRDYDFYRASIQWYREKLEKPHFLIFSDDLELAKKILGIANDINYIENTKSYSNDVEQLLCLSKCKHRILSKKSGFSLFAATIAQKKWNLQGYTLIIKEMNLAENAAEKEYVDNNFNRDPVCGWDESLSNCVLLEKNEIKELNKRYLINKYFYWDKKSLPSMSSKIKSGKSIFIFITLQTFSKTVITGMERMAKWIALYDDVHFVGEKVVNTNDEKDFFWTMQRAHPAEDINGDALGYTLYPYIELNENNRYIEFIQHIQMLERKEIYVIVRKKQGLPPLREHKKYNVKFIFVDFSDEFEIENWGCLREEDVNYLYNNADMIITFNNKICEEYTEIRNRIVYVDLQDYFPNVKRWDERIENLDEINECETKLYQYMYDMIKCFFSEKNYVES